MKLLLTSGGLTNKTIAGALEDLAGKPHEKIRVTFIITAAFGLARNSDTNYDWLVNDLQRIKIFAGSIKIINLTDITQDQLQNDLEDTDVIFMGGGNAFYLSYWMQQTGLFDMLPQLLEKKVYAGISAGSIVATQSLRSTSGAIANPDLFQNKEFATFGPASRTLGKTAKIVDFSLRPHLGSKDFPDITHEALQQIVADDGLPLYAIDDQTALKVINNEVEVVSEGEWELFKPA